MRSITGMLLHGEYSVLECIYLQSKLEDTKDPKNFEDSKDLTSAKSIYAGSRSI